MKVPRLDSPAAICFANTPVSPSLPAAFGLIALTSLCAQNQNTLAERLYLTQNIQRLQHIANNTNKSNRVRLYAINI